MGTNCHDHEHTEIPSYWHSMDSSPQHYTGNKFSAGSLSVSTPPFKNQLDSIRARIMQGATNVELGFTGTGKGGAQNLTPGTLGAPERTAIKEIAKINDVGINSVHTAMSIQGLAGLTQGKFSEDKRVQDMEEVKRTIDFAGDVTDGGAIVVHTGEFPYSITQKHGDKPFITKSGKEIKLKDLGEREKKAPYYFVDKYKGDISIAISPEFKTPVITEYNTVKQVEMDYFEKIAKTNLENKKAEHIEQYKVYTDRTPTDIEYRQTFGNKAWLANQHRINLSVIEDRARRKEYQLSVEELSSDVNNLKSKIELTEKLLKKPHKPDAEPLEGHTKKDLKDYKKLLEKTTMKRDLSQEHANAYGLRIRDQMKTAFDSIPIAEYGKIKTSESISELAMHAKKMTEKNKLSKPLFVAPENLWDGNYGSHPEDLKQIIKDARSQFIKDAVKKKKMSQNEAERAAKNHIKATFDIGHANIWRKYFGGSDNEFKQWLGSEVNKLTKEGIIGHVHVSDNFGYNDEHLPPGYGNAPIKEFMTHLEKGGYKGEIIIEPGHHDIGAYTLGMQHLETPIYRLHNQTSTWTDVQGSYFGRTYIPSFITPTYLPNIDTKQSFTWSELPLE